MTSTTLNKAEKEKHSPRTENDNKRKRKKDIRREKD